MRQRVKVSNEDVNDIAMGGDKQGVGATCYSRVKTGPDAGLFIMPLEVAREVVKNPDREWGKVELVGEPDDKDVIAKG